MQLQISRSKAAQMLRAIRRSSRISRRVFESGNRWYSACAPNGLVQIMVRNRTPQFCSVIYNLP